MSHLLRKPQQGAAAVIVALWMGVALSCLMVLDIGNMFWQQRELQKIADLAALAGASGTMDTCPVRAQENAIANHLLPSDTINKKSGYWIPGIKYDSLNKSGEGSDNSCGVKINRKVPYFFVIRTETKSRELSAEAIALRASQPLARVFVRSLLLSVDSSKPDAVLLNALVGGLLDGTANINVGGWEGLAKANISILDFLKALAKTDVELSLADYQRLLDTDITVGELLNAMVSAVERDSDKTVNILASVMSSLKVGAKISPLKLKLSQLIKLDTASLEAGLRTKINLLGLLQGGLQVANKNNALATELKLPLGGLLNAGVRLNVIEPPQWMIGDPTKIDIKAKTAQVKLEVDIPTLLGGTQVVVKVNAGGGEAVLRKNKDICSSFEVNKGVNLDVTSSLLSVGLYIDSILFRNFIKEPVRFVGDWHSSSPLEIEVPLGKSDGNIFLPASKVKSIDEKLPDEMEADQWQRFTFQGDVLNIVNYLLKELEKVFNLKLDGLGVLGDVVEGIMKTLKLILDPLLGLVGSLVEKLLSPIVTPIINIVLKLLGIDIAVADVAAQLTCDQSPELVY